MKKFYILLIAMALTAGTAFAQSNDSIERAKQQEALLKQQQKEQQELLKQQQKEQERLMKEQQKAEQKAQEERLKEQQKLQKEQQKEAEKAAKKEQDRIKREQTKAENKAKAEQKKAERKRKREEHYAAWGRRPNFTADPYVSIVSFWELAIKESLGKLNLPAPVPKMMEDCYPVFEDTDICVQTYDEPTNITVDRVIIAISEFIHEQYPDYHVLKSV